MTGFDTEGASPRPSLSGETATCCRCSPSSSQVITAPSYFNTAKASVEAKMSRTPQLCEEFFQTASAETSPKRPQKITHPSACKAHSAWAEATTFTTLSSVSAGVGPSPLFGTVPPSSARPQDTSDPSLFKATKALDVATRSTTSSRTPVSPSETPPRSGSPQVVTAPSIKAAQAPSVWYKR